MSDVFVSLNRSLYCPRVLVCLFLTRSSVAFDTVKNSSEKEAVREKGIVEPCVQILMKLYDKQWATVHTDVKSTQFSNTF